MVWVILITLGALTIWWLYAEDWGEKARRSRLAECRGWRELRKKRQQSLQALLEICPAQAQPHFFRNDERLCALRAQMEKHWQKVNVLLPPELCRKQAESPQQEIALLLRWRWQSWQARQLLEKLAAAEKETRQLLARQQADIRDLQQTIKKQIEMLGQAGTLPESQEQELLFLLLQHALQARQEAARPQRLAVAQAAVRSQLVALGIQHLQLTSLGSSLLAAFQMTDVLDTFSRLHAQMTEMLRGDFPQDWEALLALENRLSALRTKQETFQQALVQKQNLLREVGQRCLQLDRSQTLEEMQNLKQEVQMLLAAAREEWETQPGSPDWWQEAVRDGQPTKMLADFEQTTASLLDQCRRFQNDPRAIPLETLREALDDREKQRQDLLRAIETFRKTLQTFRQSRKSLTYQLNVLESALAEVTAWLEQVQAPPPAAAELGQIRREIASLHHRLGNLSPKDCEQLPQKIAATEADLKLLRSKWESELRALREKVSQVAADFSEAYRKFLLETERHPVIRSEDVGDSGLFVAYELAQGWWQSPDHFGLLTDHRNTLQGSLRQVREAHEAARSLRKKWDEAQDAVKKASGRCEKLHDEIRKARQTCRWETLHSDYDELEEDLARTRQRLLSLRNMQADALPSCKKAIQQFEQAAQEASDICDAIREKLRRLQLKDQEYLKISQNNQ